MNTPKQLSDLKHQDFVINVKPSISVHVEAERSFNELFGTDYKGDLKVNHLFTEEENGDYVKVYEAYKDSGSTDYVYLKVKS